MHQSVNPFIQNRRLGRGVNILGYDPIWKSHQAAHMQERHFRLIRQAGFDHVRINLHPFKFMGEGPEYALSPAWLQTLDWALEQSAAAGLLAILDLHEFTAMAHDPAGLKPQYLAFWRQIAARCQGAAEDVLFEILNEPNSKLTPELWNEYLLEPLAEIRASNPTRTLIIGPAFWNGFDYLARLELPDAERNLIVTVHYYHPMPFTHQGAAWSAENRHLSGIHWLGTQAEVQRIHQDMAQVQAWAEAHDRPIYLGEFGAYDKADMESRARYTHAMARAAESLGWSWGYWQFDSDFIVYDIERDGWVEPILQALIPG